MRRLGRWVSIGLATWIALASPTSAATLDVRLPTATFVLARGDTASLVVEIHNAGDTDVLINGAAQDFTADVGGAAISAVLLDRLPGVVAPGEMWRGAVGTFEIAPDAALGRRLFVIDLIGGETDYDTVRVGGANLAVVVQDPACLASIAQQPANATADVGDPVAFSILANGAGTLAYQWRRNGEDLADGGGVSGTQSASLALASATLGDAGNYDVLITNDCGAVASLTVKLAIAGVTGVPAPVAALPLALDAPSPNPFGASTALHWTMPRAGFVRLRVYDLGGRPVVVLAQRIFPAGAHAMRWDGRDRLGRAVRPGLYMVRLEIDGRSLARKLTRIE